MTPSMYPSQMPQSAYMPVSAAAAAAAAQAPFYPGTSVDPGRVSTGLPGQPVSATAAPSALSKGT